MILAINTEIYTNQALDSLYHKAPTVFSLFIIFYLIFNYFNKNKKDFVFILDIFENISLNKLRKNDLFINEQNIRNKINDIKFENKLKTDLALILLNNKWNSIIKYSNNLLRVSNIKRMGKVEFCNLMSNHPVIIIKDYETKTLIDFEEYFIKNNNISRNDAKKLAIKYFDVVYYDSTCGFAQQHTLKVQIIYTFLSNMGYSSINNLMNIHILFVMYYSAMINAIEDMKDTFNKLNGRFSKIQIEDENN